jgi:hypothetical protein
MRRVRLDEIAYGRSGDKGDDSNVGIWARTDAGYEVLKRELTPERVKAHLAGLGTDEVLRYELPHLRALNFILGHSLAGGGSGSVRTDAQGKVHARGLLFMEIDIPEDFPAAEA